MAYNINTSAPAYQNAEDVLDFLLANIDDRLERFWYLPKAQKIDWLQRDPVFRKVLKLAHKKKVRKVIDRLEATING